MTLYLLKYNKYFNRKILYEDTIDGYQSYVQKIVEHVSFIPNDNLTTTQILNVSDVNADYLLVTDMNTTAGTEYIHSRWFIINYKRTRGGQYELTLRRDVLADHIEELKDAPMFIEKAIVDDSNPLIVNDEGMQFNKVKKSETLLKDKSGVPWIVGYIASNSEAKDIEVAADIDTNYVSLKEIADAMNTKESWLSAQVLLPGQSNIETHFTSKVEMRYGTDNKKNQIFFTGDFSSATSKVTDTVKFSNPLFKILYDITYEYNVHNKAIRDEYITQCKYYASDLMNTGMPSVTNRSYYFTDKQFDILNTYNGKTVLYNGKYYRLNIVGGSSYTPANAPVPYGNLSIFNTITTLIGGIAEAKEWATLLSTGYMSIIPTSNIYYLKLEELDNSSIKTVISSSRKKLKSDTYDMFCIPANNIYIKEYAASSNKILQPENIAQKISIQIAKDLSSSCYDVQLLPYCPLPNIISEDNTISLSGLVEDQDFSYIKSTGQTTQTGTITLEGGWTKPTGSLQWQCSQLIPTAMRNDCRIIGYKVISPDDVGSVQLKLTDTTIEGKCVSLSSTTGSDIVIEVTVQFLTAEGTDTNIGVILWCEENSFRTQIECPLTLKHSMKIDSNCDMYRLCSPNYQGSFDFNIAKNGGSVDYFNVECTYKPYTPYIRVAPNFKWLYGGEYGDARGLICGGDFSLSRVNDAWESYQLQNKNYQNIFNREIQSMDYQNSIAMRNQIVSASVGVLKGGATGIAGGAIAGGPIGAVAGGVMGAVSSTVGAVMDTQTLYDQQKEQRSLAVDKYNYQLGNIQALPYTLTKVGTFDISSKYFPFIEYYTCTDEEIEALELKIKYESMTVMKIGSLEEYKQEEPTYIKGSLILANTTVFGEEISNQELYAAYNELAKGVWY